MKATLIVLGVLAVLGIVLGVMDGGRPIGQTVILAGAIILSGVLVSLALIENRRD